MLIKELCKFERINEYVKCSVCGREVKTKSDNVKAVCHKGQWKKVENKSGCGCSGA